MARDPYPLQWPDGWKRTSQDLRETPRFKAQFARDRDRVRHQLELMRCTQIVITSDLPLRNDGIPYANATCADPGIAVWWIKNGREHVIASDRWRTVSYNMRAIDMTISAIRGMDRWGTSRIVESAFAGFAALPPPPSQQPPTPSPVKRNWVEVFDVGALYFLFKGGQFHSSDVLRIVRARYRDLIKRAHPDVGGSAEAAAELGEALLAAEQELT